MEPPLAEKMNASTVHVDFEPVLQAMREQELEQKKLEDEARDAERHSRRKEERKQANLEADRLRLQQVHVGLEPVLQAIRDHELEREA